MLEQKVTFNKIDLWHLIPIVLFTIYSLPMLMTPATELIPQIESRWFKNRIFSSTEINITLSPHRLLIFAFSCYLFGVIKRKKEKHTQFAMTSFIDWISGLNIGFGLYWILSFMVIFLLGFQQRIGLNHYHFVMIFMALFIYGLAYLSIAKNKEFSIIFLEGRIEKYQKNSVPNKVLNQYLQEIKNFFETEKPYLNPELRLTDVAAKLGVSPNTISQTINLQTGKNYYEYVNEYRHLEFRKKLKGKNTKRFTILALALESGYNNKQTAINIFKKYEGCTPSQFLKIENTQV